MEPGVYFNLDEDEYRAAPAFGSSSIKDAHVSPLTCWIGSPFNPNRPDGSTDAKVRGRAFHKRLLEGHEAFEDAYAVAPRRDDHPDALEKGDDLRAACKDAGLSPAGTNGAMLERLREAGHEVEFWPEIRDAFKAANDGKTIIPGPLHDDIERQAAIVEMHESARKAFHGGYPEASLFWTDEETGLPCKARCDYLKTRAIVDVKTFSNPMGMPLDTAVSRSVANYRYHYQAAMYLDGIENVKALIRRDPNAVHGEAPDDWMTALVEPGPHAFVWVFLEAGDVPNVRVRTFARTETHGGNGATENLYWRSANDGYRGALAIIKTCVEFYGFDMPWVAPEQMRAFTDQDFPMWMLE